MRSFYLRILCLLLVLTFLFSLFPIGAAASSFEESLPDVSAAKNVYLGVVSDIQAQVAAINEAISSIVSAVAPIDADGGATASYMPALLPGKREG